MCTTCGKGYSYKHLLNEHTWKEHGEGQHIRWFDHISFQNCFYFTRVFFFQKHTSHLLSYRFPCNWEGCDYTAKYKQTLHTHVMERHHGVKRKHRQEVGLAHELFYV